MKISTCRRRTYLTKRAELFPTGGVIVDDHMTGRGPLNPHIPTLGQPRVSIVEIVRYGNITGIHCYTVHAPLHAVDIYVSVGRGGSGVRGFTRCIDQLRDGRVLHEAGGHPQEAGRGREGVKVRCRHDHLYHALVAGCSSVLLLLLLLLWKRLGR